MEKARRFLKKHVIFTALISIIIFLVIHSSLPRFIPDEKAMKMYLEGDPSLNLLLGDATRIIAILFFTLPFMKFLGTFDASGIKSTVGIGKGLLLGSGIVLLSWIMVIYSMADTIKISMNAGLFSWSDWRFGGIGITLLVVVTCLLVGVLEETLCRGILFLNMFDKWGNTREGLWKAIILSALPFGLLHLLNLNSATFGFDKWAVIFQVIYATTSGMFLAVLYLRCKNIWALILVHGLIDLAQFSFYIFIPSDIMYYMDKLNVMTQNNFVQQSAVYMIFALGFLIAGLIMLRKVEVDENKFNEVAKIVAMKFSQL